MRDQAVLERIADSLHLKNDEQNNETVVEIGPGRGALTELLVPRSGKLILIEIDRALAQMLRERYAGNPNVTVIENDVLKVHLGEVAGKGYSLIGNVPYYITTPILFHALVPPLPKQMVFLVQREVAERIIAKPGTKEYGALSVNLQVLTEPELLFTVPASAFSPPPKVESAVIRLIPKKFDVSEKFQDFVIAVFGMRRKQLQRILKSLYPEMDADALLESLEIDPSARPETLTPERFLELFLAVSQGKR